jgi:hypothetical protein
MLDPSGNRTQNQSELRPALMLLLSVDTFFLPLLILQHNYMGSNAAKVAVVRPSPFTVGYLKQHQHQHHQHSLLPLVITTTGSGEEEVGGHASSSSEGSLAGGGEEVSEDCLSVIDECDNVGRKEME